MQLYPQPLGRRSKETSSFNKSSSNREAKADRIGWIIHCVMGIRRQERLLGNRGFGALLSPPATCAPPTFRVRKGVTTFLCHACKLGFVTVMGTLDPVPELRIAELLIRLLDED